MSKLFHFFLLSALCLGCSNKKTIDGLWQVTLFLENQNLDFEIEINKNKAILFNGPESIDLSVEKEKNHYLIPITNFNAAFEVTLKNNELRGHWIKYDKKPEYKVVLTGKKIKSRQNLLTNISLPKKWKIDFYENDKIQSSEILLFSQKNNIAYASVLTPTGDYRYLTPSFNKDEIILKGFDGIFAYKLIGKLKENQIKGIMHAGKNFSQSFIANINDSFELEDPSTITKIPVKSLNICLPELSGEKLCLNPSSKKTKIIQFFGSWCPNCIDETKFLLEYRKKNPSDDIEYFIISFERSLDKKSALKSLKKTQKMYNIDYPILIAAYTNETKVSDVIKGVENFKAFPTMVIINKKGIIEKIHAGFSGPATGKYYENFKEDFDQTIRRIQTF